MRFNEWNTIVNTECHTTLSGLYICMHSLDYIHKHACKTFFNNDVVIICSMIVTLYNKHSIHIRLYMHWQQTPSSLGGQVSWHKLWVWVFQKHLENYMDGVDSVHCTKGTYNLSELVAVKLMLEVMYQMWVFTNYCFLKLVKVWGVPEKSPCVIAIVNSLLMIIEVI